MMVRTPKTVPQGSSLGFSLYLDSSMKPVVGAGSVMRVVGENQMGILLNRMSVAETNRLQEFLMPMIVRE